MAGIPAWAVAAALLLPYRSLHYTDLANQIVQSGLSRLGMDGRTPAASIGSIMRRVVMLDGRPMFTWAWGEYWLTDPAYVRRHHPKVKAALEALQSTP